MPSKSTGTGVTSSAAPQSAFWHRSGGAAAAIPGPPRGRAAASADANKSATLTHTTSPPRALRQARCELRLWCPRFARDRRGGVLVVSRAGVALAHDSAVSSGTLASKELLRRLDFRGIAAPVAPSLRRLTVRHSSPADGPGHTAVRKFIKNFLPVILYAHPRVEARVERAAGAAPGVEATHADGRVEWHDAAAVAAACERRGDRELFRLLTDTEPPESGGVREAPRKRKRRPAAAAGAPAGAAPTAGDAEA